MMRHGGMDYSQFEENNEMTETRYGPHPAAANAAVARLAGSLDVLREDVRDALEAAHAPALRVRERSFSGEYVIAWLERMAAETSNIRQRKTIEYVARHFEDSHDVR